MFPIAALLEVGNINLNRVELIWSAITTHLSEVRERDKTKKERENCFYYYNCILPQVCSVGSPSLRAFAAEALTLLIRTSLENYSEEVCSTDNPSISVPSQFSISILPIYFPFQKIQLMLLRPLESMTRVPHSDVRQKQMDCITHVCLDGAQLMGM